MDPIFIIDVIGTVVFAISGALTAIDEEMDVFGAGTVAFVTALGGGTLRDLLLGSTPPSWAMNPDTLIYVFLGLLLAVIFKSRILKLRKTLFLFDTIGIAVFTVLGIEKTLEMGLSPIVAVMMGVVSAVFGGVIRDIICNQVPLIFRKEIYALVCLVAGVIYVFVLGNTLLSREIQISIIIVLVVISRIWIVKKSISLPPLRRANKS